jgi:hypothetical protein
MASTTRISPARAMQGRARLVLYSLTGEATAHKAGTTVPDGFAGNPALLIRPVLELPCELSTTLCRSVMSTRLTLGAVPLLYIYAFKEGD